MKCAILFGLLLVQHVSFSQSISPGVFSAAGGDIISSEYTVEWILAEVLVPSYEGPDHVSGGILGSGIKYVFTGMDDGKQGPSIASYPNPFSESLSIETQADINPLKFFFYDIVGRAIDLPVIYSDKHKKIFLSDKILPGIYFVRITDPKNSELHQIKLIRE